MNKDKFQEYHAQKYQQAHENKGNERKFQVGIYTVFAYLSSVFRDETSNFLTMGVIPYMVSVLILYTICSTIVLIVVESFKYLKYFH